MACASVFLFIHPPIHPVTCSFISPSIHSIYPPCHPSISLSHLLTYPSISTWTSLLNPSANPFNLSLPSNMFHPSIYSSIHPFILHPHPVTPSSYLFLHSIWTQALGSRTRIWCCGDTDMKESLSCSQHRNRVRSNYEGNSRIKEGLERSDRKNMAEGAEWG